MSSRKAFTPEASMSSMLTPSTPGGPSVFTDFAPGPGKHVGAGDLVVEGMEPALRVLLGTVVERVGGNHSDTPPSGRNSRGSRGNPPLFARSLVERGCVRSGAGATRSRDPAAARDRRCPGLPGHPLCVGLGRGTPAHAAVRLRHPPPA